MSKQGVIVQEGTIYEVLSNTMFRVRLKNGHEVLATVSGKMKMRYVRMVPGDKVSLEMSPYDLSRGRIKLRLQQENRTSTYSPARHKKKKYR